MGFFNAIMAILVMTSGSKFKTEIIIGKKKKNKNKKNQGATCNAILMRYRGFL